MVTALLVAPGQSAVATVDRSAPAIGGRPCLPFDNPAEPVRAAAPVAVHAPVVATKAADPAGKANLATLSIQLMTQGDEDDAVSVAALNVVTGARFAEGATSGMTEGSVVKLDILETLLLQHQDAGTWLTDSEASLATVMIENSDNDAATALYDDVGGAPGVRAANARLGLASTSLAEDDEWGLTTTSATDQLMLLRNLTASGPIGDMSRAYALGLMQEVQPDQAWGVSVAGDPGSATALKNGWLSVVRDDERWLTNSVGVVTVHGQRILVAILTQHNESFEAGVDRTQSLTAAVVSAVAS